MSDSLFGAMTPDQQQQMLRNMYAMQLMRGTQGQTTPQSSGLGALGNAASPIMNALMYRQVMNQGQQPPMPTSAPPNFGAPGPGTSYNALTGYMPNTAGGQIGGMNLSPAQGGVASGPGLFSRIGNWFSNLTSPGGASSGV